MSGFDRIVVVDWSARSQPSPKKPTADSIWIASAYQGQIDVQYHRTRAAATDALIAEMETALSKDERLLAGFDFPFAYPKGFAERVTGSAGPLGLWGALAGRVEDSADNANNRWDLARALNGLFPGIGPFWGCPPGEATADLPARGSARRDHGLPERRLVEEKLPRAQPCWKLYTTGSVGSQVLLGLPRLHQLRLRFGTALSVSPFEAPTTPLVLAEVYPSLLAEAIAARRGEDEILDAAQVRVVSEALAALPPDRLDVMLREGDPEEGWLLGLGHEAELVAGLTPVSPLQPPPLRDDCFALPAGVDWTPVADAMARLRAALAPVTGRETEPITEGTGRILAEDVAALRSHPPAANTAVDGYGFAADTIGSGPYTLPLVPGRAAAGVPFAGSVPPGSALRVLTGAPLPDGVDTVVLDEDCATDGHALAFRGPIKRGANIRKAGEDVREGDAILPAGQVLRAPDIALLSATGHGTVPVRKRLRVAILSTGDEIVAPGAPALAGQIYDANHPMLSSLVAGWQYDLIDLGRAPDDAAAVRDALNAGAAQADAILTSGGASAGDEDHVSTLLRDEGHLTSWRIALKPGRPLALAMWQGRPVFGLPGNPVAALVCTLLFARPALAALAGAGWPEPMRVTVPAAFSKRKKPGRSEYLRARLTGDGRAEVFASEGSGRVSGLVWAEGLVELGPEAREIAPGDPVTYLPYTGFGF